METGTGRLRKERCRAPGRQKHNASVFWKMLLGSQLQGCGDTAKPLHSLGSQWKQLLTLVKNGPSTSQLHQELEERCLRMKRPLRRRCVRKLGRKRGGIKAEDFDLVVH